MFSSAPVATRWRGRDGAHFIASGALFGGLALFGAWYGLKEGFSSNLFWYFWGLIAAG